MYLYADDAILINSHEKSENINDKVSHDMKLILEFLEQQIMFLNIEKTNFIIFHSHQMKLSDPNEILINNEIRLTRVACIKYLGIMMDEHLKWNLHYDSLEKKLASTSGLLWKLRHKLPQRIKKLIYHTLFESQINYLSTIHGTADDCTIDRVQKIQNQALRNVFNLDRRDNRVYMYSHCVENCLPVRALHFINTAVFVFSNLKQRIHTNVEFKKSTGITRSNEKCQLIKPASKTKFGKKRISSYGVNIYNNIDIKIKKLPHVHAFKWALKCSIRTEDFITACLNGDYLRRYVNI